MKFTFKVSFCLMLWASLFHTSVFNCIAETYVNDPTQQKRIVKQGLFCSYSSANNLLLYKKTYKPGDESGQLYLYDINKQKEFIICDTIDMLTPDPVFFDSVTILIPTTGQIVAYNTKTKGRRIVFKTRHDDQWFNGFHFDPLTRNIITTLLDNKSSEAFLLIMNIKGEVLHKVKVAYDFDHAGEESYSRIFTFNGTIIFNMLDKLFSFTPSVNKTALIAEISFSYDKPVFFVTDSALMFSKWKSFDMSVLKKSASVSTTKLPAIFIRDGRFDFATYTFQVNDQNVNYISNKQKTISIQDSKLEYVNTIVSIVKTDRYSISQDLSKNTLVIQYN